MMIGKASRSVIDIIICVTFQANLLFVISVILLPLANQVLSLRNQDDSNVWKYLSRIDSSLRPMKDPTGNVRLGNGHDFLQIFVNINASILDVAINNEVVYSMHGGHAAMGHRWNHSGIHLVVISTQNTSTYPEEAPGRASNPWSRIPRVVLTQRFITYQPWETKDLVATLDSLQPGRIAVVIGVPEWLMFLGEEGERSLKEMGFSVPSKVANMEPWIGVAITGLKTVIAESVSTASGKVFPNNALYFETSVPIKAVNDANCEWQTRPGMRQQAEFCKLYDGYGDLCSCHLPFHHGIRLLQRKINMKENIPVVVVTANKPRRLFRILKNIFTVPGAGQTKVLVVVDGQNTETFHLLNVLRVEGIVHAPKGLHNERTNANVRFALYSVFRRYMEADKAILLEDDLILSPDILSFFHQAAWVLNNDPTVFCINAFNSNSLPSVAADTTKLLRSESYPMYGWMVRRHYALQVITTNWVIGNEGDWDWWLMRANAQRNRDVVAPEVSRTFHAGSAGAHVDGFEQLLYFGRMIATTESTIRLKNLRGVLLENYLQSLKEEIQKAEMLTPDPTQSEVLPEGRPGPFVAFVRAGTRSDEFFSFRTFMMNLRTYYWDTREIFRGVMRFNIRGRILYVVGCPLSQEFCKYNPKGYAIIGPTFDLLQEVRRINDKYEQSQYEITGRKRVPYGNPAKEASLDNLIKVK